MSAAVAMERGPTVNGLRRAYRTCEEASAFDAGHPWQIALLKKNTDTVVRTLRGWKTTRLTSAKDGAGVVIYSQWGHSRILGAASAAPPPGVQSE